MNESVAARWHATAASPPLVRRGSTKASSCKSLGVDSSLQHRAGADGGWETTTCQVGRSQLCGVMSLQFLSTTQLTCAFDAGETRAKPTRPGGRGELDALIKLFSRREAIIH